MVSKAFSATMRDGFKGVVNSLAKNLASNVKSFIFKINKSNLFVRGTNFSKLNRSQKREFANEIINYTKESKSLSSNMEKEPKKNAKELECLKKSTSMLKNMYQDAKELFRHEIGKQYSKNSGYKPNILSGLGVKALAKIFIENDNRSQKKQPLIQTKQIQKMSHERLQGVKHMDKGRGANLEHGVDLGMKKK